MLETPLRTSDQGENTNIASKSSLVLESSKDQVITDNNSQTLVKSLIELENEGKQYDKQKRHNQKASGAKAEGLHSFK